MREKQGKPKRSIWEDEQWEFHEKSNISNGSVESMTNKSENRE